MNGPDQGAGSQLDALRDAQWIAVDSPWGKPSNALLVGHIGTTRCVFLPRHGRGRRIGPSQLNSRANIDIMKPAGVTDLLSVSAVGSLCEDKAPGHFVCVDQFIDRTTARDKSFFGEGLVAHVSMADPVRPRLSALAHDAAQATGTKVHARATYIAMEGPQFSSRAEAAGLPYDVDMPVGHGIEGAGIKRGADHGPSVIELGPLCKGDAQPLRMA